MLRKKNCQENLKILPEFMFYPFGEKSWKQLFKCSNTRKDQRVIDIQCISENLFHMENIPGVRQEAERLAWPPSVDRPQQHYPDRGHAGGLSSDQPRGGSLSSHIHQGDQE